MKPSAFLLPIFLLFCTFSCDSQNEKIMDTSTVKELDLDRYLGVWYEIARFDHSFERGLVGVTATYSLRPDGKITVVNQGYKNSLDGKLSIANGKAKIPDKTKPGRLKVSFFLFFYADYFVLELGENYEWALIGSSSDKYLWILSRTPQLAPATYETILDKARERGYDTSRLIEVGQKK